MDKDEGDWILLDTVLAADWLVYKGAQLPTTRMARSNHDQRCKVCRFDDHSMSRVYTDCRNRPCMEANGYCEARYLYLVCNETRTVDVYRMGNHTARGTPDDREAGPDALMHPSPRMTPVVRALFVEMASADPARRPIDIYRELEERRLEFNNILPRLQSVQSLVSRLRKAMTSDSDRPAAVDDRRRRRARRLPQRPTAPANEARPCTCAIKEYRPPVVVSTMCETPRTFNSPVLL
ncbi:hypothetical protein SDRG_09588 [Saprolegnia diclina VS20]|uniref:Uncharacterized protein n=1 Tax=Saprolegnia diclina (strain VS20) TaxID=1156394 RepID=T0Q5F3_SAPDV|nr:hypothetical protein SDRG_09588 [Saprolegnia diclina VS20]EQC33069.1 hypothetical protein SDRG_09588 [Saprolegnia diclina VS20]|eukprot:XP_008613755.1 hypothetical protein SDRG_09588 [Saprolegnia diclina VS20]